MYQIVEVKERNKLFAEQKYRGYLLILISEWPDHSVCSFVCQIYLAPSSCFQYCIFYEKLLSS